MGVLLSAMGEDRTDGTELSSEWTGVDASEGLVERGRVETGGKDVHSAGGTGVGAGMGDGMLEEHGGDRGDGDEGLDDRIEKAGVAQIREAWTVRLGSCPGGREGGRMGR